MRAAFFNAAPRSRELVGVRNVDVAFRTTTLRTADGRVVSGLVRREEGQQLVLAGADGKEFTVAKSEIEDRKQSTVSMMPEGLFEKLSDEEIRDLIAYLASPKQVPLPKVGTENH